ncbi:FMN-binding negative transcriptional regulator [Aeromicrobium wangtongii]|uniref:FMN-binding negative transcriptional regulator n=1 Tax=Aeromicrobium wangtongii TaxID=2969247 RepID=A0ABY5MCV5_9ACTN|nr:FMN-binding negative transcriptional regulator [Aeromicrobium wangtongii]MCD9197002.1 FMN-binding negative transcriptional regulator [Aeromicrobium wangtongii]UUP14503.1 FMN-binding negative transcriptional regulator [Aeromicrobium wangtongii]
MRPNPQYATTDEQVARQLIAENPWAMLISHHDGQLVASRYPVLLDEAADGLTLVTHVGRPDEKLHGLGEHEVLVVFEGAHGYVSPSWYAPGSSRIPTWNFSALHCWGTPRILDADENLDVLTRLTAHFEQHVDEPMWLDRESSAPVARGTVGLRIPVDRFECKIKMSQDKDPVSVQNVIDHLRAPGPYQQPRLADDMERARAAGIGGPAAE